MARIRIEQSAKVVSRVINLLLGGGIATPSAEIMKRHPYFPFNF